MAPGNSRPDKQASADPDLPVLLQDDSEAATQAGAPSHPTGEPLSGPFGPRQLWRIDEALSAADRESGLRFSVYVGELAKPSRVAAEQLHDRIPGSERAILLAVSPNQRVLEIVTGSRAGRMVPDRVCALAALSMTASFEGGDLTAGIVTGLRMLADQAAAGG